MRGASCEFVDVLDGEGATDPSLQPVPVHCLTSGCARPGAGTATLSSSLWIPVVAGYVTARILKKTGMLGSG